MVIMDQSIVVFYQNWPENGQFWAQSCNFCLKIEITRNNTGKHNKTWVIFFWETKMKPIKYVGRMVIMDHSIFYLFLNQNRPENGQFGGKSCNFGLKIEITCIYTGKHIKVWVISFQVTKMKPMKYGGHVVIMDHSIVFFKSK